jgi:hypothetical protein
MNPLSPRKEENVHESGTFKRKKSFSTGYVMTMFRAQEKLSEAELTKGMW